jgi:hypothetical protein
MKDKNISTSACFHAKEGKMESGKGGGGVIKVAQNR